MRTLILCSCATILALLPSCSLSVAPIDGGFCPPPVLRVPVYAGGFCPPPAPLYGGWNGGGFCPPIYRRPVITYGYRGGFCPPPAFRGCAPPPRRFCR